jgi:hypothetical protein
VNPVCVSSNLIGHPVSKKERKRRKKIAKIEERSDRRTADFVMRRIDEIQTELADLIPDLQTFEHWCEISQMSYIIRLLKDMRKKYRKISDGHTWEESD